MYAYFLPHNRKQKKKYNVNGQNDISQIMEHLKVGIKRGRGWSSTVTEQDPMGPSQNQLPTPHHVLHLPIVRRETLAS